MKMQETGRRIVMAATVTLASWWGVAARAEVKLPAVLSSHMVLQRDVPINVWGWAAENEEVTVELGSATARATVGADGRWSVQLPPQKMNKTPQQLTVRGSNEIVLTDILIGEVWIGSGQSNMEWPLSATMQAKEAIAAADFPQIRLFHVPKVQFPEPQDDVKAQWNACSPKTIPGFSGVLYYFGRRLHQELDVPVGLINSSWGGSPIEPWTRAGGKSGGMYNGMIAPLTSFAVRGAIWYQGETNVLQKNGLAYADKMKALIDGWREAFGNDKLSFYFVQIAPWKGRYEPGQLPALWEAQVASLRIPRTGMAVTTDLVDDLGDIHPRNKLDVGQRLALWALAKDYGKESLIYSGPLYKSMAVEGDSIRIHFAHAGEALKASDGKPLREFKIAGADGKFIDAEAVIDGLTVVVKSPEVAAPQHVQFGWHALANPNLTNSAGLPASPFQTKEWTGATGE